jgi:hypothetical protein
MLNAYFDDSGTHHGSRVALLAGFVATTEVWRSLKREWSALLGEFTGYGVTHFHAREHCWPRRMGAIGNAISSPHA